MPSQFSIDGDAVRQLAELLNETGLTEIEYDVEGCRIRVAKNITAAVSVPTAPQYVQAAPAAAVTGLREDGPPPVQSASDLRNHPGAVKSPMVGTAYMASAPGAAPFVKEGDSVAQGDTLVIIEAMKVMNPIRAPKAGKVTSILVKDADPIEFGTVLIIIE